MKIDNSEERLYYIYRHLRKSNEKLFYIGLGKKPKNYNTQKQEYGRAFNRLRRNTHWINIYKKHGVIVEIILENLTKGEANIKEKEFISLYGKIDKGGLLCNLTDGGDGTNGIVISKEIIAKKSKQQSIGLEKLIQKNIFPEPNTGCWLWGGTARIEKNPSVTCKNKSFSVRRVLMSPTDEELVIDACNNSICVNPTHLVKISRSTFFSQLNSK